MGDANDLIPTAMAGDAVAAAARSGGIAEADVIPMLRIGWRESKWVAAAHRTTVAKSLLRGDLGLVQINYTNDTEAARKAVGYSTRDQWFDPVVNMRMAAYLIADNRRRGGDGFDAWRAGADGYTAGGDAFYGTPTAEAVSKAVTERKRLDDTPGFSVGDVAGGALGAIGSALGVVAAWPALLAQLLRTILDGKWWRRVGIAVIGLAVIVAALVFAAMK